MNDKPLAEKSERELLIELAERRGFSNGITCVLVIMLWIAIIGAAIWGLLR